MDSSAGILEMPSNQDDTENSDLIETRSLNQPERSNSAPNVYDYVIQNINNGALNIKYFFILEKNLQILMKMIF